MSCKRKLEQQLDKVVRHNHQLQVENKQLKEYIAYLIAYLDRKKLPMEYELWKQQEKAGERNG